MKAALVLHQDEGFDNANLGTCMDYTNDPDGTIYGQLNNEKPNEHDYDMMTEIYAHLNPVDGGEGGTKPPKEDNPNNIFPFVITTSGFLCNVGFNIR